VTFFNKKEDVMAIELTPHGRKLLSQGKLKPAYYCFFDDDIIYDSESVGFSENNTKSKTRIVSDTPSLKPQTTYRGVDENKIFDQVSIEGENVLPNPIGSNKTTFEKANGWEVTAILGEISSSVNCISSQTSATINIPQVECELNFTMSIGLIGNDNYISKDYISSQVARDQTFIKLKHEKLLLHLLEKGGFEYKDSLSIETYKYSYDEATLNKIQFLGTQDDLMHDILVEIPPDENVNNFGDTSAVTDENIVENYFFINLDRQIENSSLCRGIKKLKEQNIYLGLDIECDEQEYDEINIYQTEVTDTDIEDCE
jgi:hypothetical protein|tara:strand:+ start:502 stop:1443 length:942 start_codon:yes stop_codon:yes gene_type:complete